MEAGTGLFEGASFLLAGGGGSVFFGESSFLAGVESAENYKPQLLKVRSGSVSASQMNLLAGESSRFIDHMHANRISLLVVFLVKASRNTHTLLLRYLPEQVSALRSLYRHVWWQSCTCVIVLHIRPWMRRAHPLLLATSVHPHDWASAFPQQAVLRSQLPAHWAVALLAAASA